MNNAMVLDCTLRDGGYIIDKKFGDENITGIINGLVEANIDIVEIGFLQNEGEGDGKPIFLKSTDAEKYIPANKKNTMFAVLADYSRYSASNLDDYSGKSFEIVRCCFFKHEVSGALEMIKEIKQKGYKVFVQPVDVLGYSDIELVELIQSVNKIEPYGFSIVDTFGSMYSEDLHHIYSLVDNNLLKTIRIGFHSHNNMQLSNALAQDFLNLAASKRNVVVDTTLSGMGRGAGNTPTELVVQYMVSKMNYPYDIDVILDVIDTYIEKFRLKAAWGYTTSLFLAGAYGSHVNNISYLLKKNSITSKDIRFILNKIGNQNRKRYNYGLLEETYCNYMDSIVDDEKSIEELREKLADKNVLILVPGKSLQTQGEKIADFISENEVFTISVNFMSDKIASDAVYLSNKKRYEEIKNNKRFIESSKIITSNIPGAENNEKVNIVSFVRLIKCGWEYMDNSVILLLRLLDLVGVKKIFIAGFDGYSCSENYVDNNMEKYKSDEEKQRINEDIESMLADFLQCRQSVEAITCITSSRFSHILK